MKIHLEIDRRKSSGVRQGAGNPSSSARRSIVSSTRIRRCAFTLIELLVVITVILVLTGLILGVVDQVMQTTRKSKARLDVKAFKSAIEQYFAMYGHMPACGDGSRLDDPDALLNTLMGSNGTSGAQGVSGLGNGFADCGITTNVVTQHGSSNPKGIVFLSLGLKEVCDSYGDGQAAIWIDPWGIPYNFAYDSNENGVIDGTDSLWAGTNWAGIIPNNQWYVNCGEIKKNQGLSDLHGTTYINSLPTNIRKYSIMWSDGPDRLNGWGNSAQPYSADDIVSW